MEPQANGEWGRAYIHIDMDAFFAAIEVRENPQLKGKPVIIGGDPRGRGVVSTCSYEARKFGVHSAMSCSEAYRLCPQGIFLRGNYALYSAVSREIHAIFDEFTPLVLPLSCDEAFLDVTGMERLLGDPVTIAEKIRREIFERVRLTASAGVAGTMFVAKLASDLNKPDGLTVIRDDEVIERLAPLAVGRIWGLGKVGVRRVNALGIRTIGELQEWPEPELVGALGNIGGHLYRLCRGIDERVITPESEREKSVSNETTFPEDLLDLTELEKSLLYLADKVARRCRRYGLEGRVVQLKVKYSDFKQVTRRQSLDKFTASSQLIYDLVKRLLRTKTEAGMRPIRLLGVGLSGFSEDNAEGLRQASLFDAEAGSESELEQKMSEVDVATDLIAKKFSDTGLIGRATLVFDQQRQKHRKKEG